jgi:hypothetical protein
MKKKNIGQESRTRQIGNGWKMAKTLIIISSQMKLGQCQK